jgi:hypothetical protein
LVEPHCSNATSIPQLSAVDVIHFGTPIALTLFVNPSPKKGASAMKVAMVSLVTLALTCGILAPTALGQKGMGEPSGVARQSIKPEVITLSGKLAEIKTGPCEKTTGKSPIGTHLMLETDKGDRLNIHLGPETAVADIVAKLTIGQTIAVKAFRTDKMPEKHYTAQSLSFGTTTIELRDAGLRPVWAGRGAGRGEAAVQSTDATDNAPNLVAPFGPGRGRRGGGPPPWAGGGRGRGGRGSDTTFEADRAIFHSLLEDHQQIHRTVTKRANGVETVTESDDPNVALAIQGHAVAMHERVQKVLPIHMRDPLFAAVFGNAAKIKMEITKTDKGVRVIETSDSPYVVKLIQAHADVVSKFVANGFLEVRQNHPVPKP